MRIAWKLFSGFAGGALLLDACSQLARLWLSWRGLPRKSSADFWDRLATKLTEDW